MVGKYFHRRRGKIDLYLIKKRIKSVLTKNMLSRLLVAMMLFSLLQPLFVSPDVASAETATGEDYFTTIPRDGYSEEVVITDYTGPDKDVVIPSTIGGKK